MSEKKIRVAVLGTRGIPGVMGGVETHCQELFSRIVAHGHHVTLFGRSPYLENKKSYDYCGIQVVPLWAPRKKYLEAITQTFLGVMYVVRHRGQFDLLHIHGIGPAIMVPLAKFFGITVVMTHHGPDYDRQKWGRVAKLVLRAGEYFGCRFSNVVIGVSRHIVKQIQIRFRTLSYYIPNGVNLPALQPSGPMLARYGLRPGKYILAVGRFVPEKGFHDLLQSFAACKTDWKLVIAGDADHVDEYSRKLTAQGGRDPRVVFPGFISGDNLAEIFSHAGLFVLPSYHEGLPIALLEAISYRLPILVSDIPANLELASTREIFPVGDIDSLTGKLQALLSEQLLEASSLTRLEKEFNWDVIACQVEELYLAMVKK